MFNLDLDILKPKKQRIDWHFKDISPDKFELTLVQNVESEYAISIFEKNSMGAQATELFREAPEIKLFQLSPQYHGLIKTAMAGKIKEVNETLKKQKIKITSYDVSQSTRYTKLNDVFKVYILITGYYVRL